MPVLDRYILRAVATPLLLALGVAAMLLLLEHMLRLFDFVLAEQGPVDVVWRMLANLAPHYLGLALPLGTLLGILFAFRHFSMSSELDALSSSGASFLRLLRPVYMMVLALMAFDFLLVGYIQPFASYEYRQIRFDVTSGALGVKIPAGEYIEISDDVTIRLGEINAETRDAKDIFLERRAEDGSVTTITASRGAISTTPEIRSLLMELEKGRQVIVGAGGADIKSLSFDSFDLEVDLPAIGVFRDRGGDARESTFNEILSLVRRETPETSPLWYDYRAELHWRILHAATFLVIPILAIAAGVTGRRRASSLKPIAGVAVLIVYHELAEEWGTVVARNGELSPYISLWGLFAIFTAVSFFMYNGVLDQARSANVRSRRKNAPVRVAAAQPNTAASSPRAPETSPAE